MSYPRYNPTTGRWEIPNEYTGGPPQVLGNQRRPYHFGSLGPEQFPIPDENVAQEILGQYGLRPTEQVNPYLFFDGQGFEQRHPKITNVLEGILSGLAFTQPSETIGEGISNVAKAFLTSRQAHQANVDRQLMAPYGMASQMQKLKGDQADLEYRQAMTEYYKDYAKYTREGRNRPQPKQYSDIVDRPDGRYGLTPEGTYEKIPGVTGKPSSATPSHLKDSYERMAWRALRADGVEDPLATENLGDFQMEVERLRKALPTAVNVGSAEGKTKVDREYGGLSDEDKQKYQFELNELNKGLIPVPGDSNYSHRESKKLAEAMGIGVGLKDRGQRVKVWKEYNASKRSEFAKRWEKSEVPAPTKTRPSVVAPALKAPPQHVIDAAQEGQVIYLNGKPAFKKQGGKAVPVGR